MYNHIERFFNLVKGRLGECDQCYNPMSGKKRVSILFANHVDALALRFDFRHCRLCTNLS